MLQTINYELTISMQIFDRVRLMRWELHHKFDSSSKVTWGEFLTERGWWKCRFLLVHDSPEIILSILQNGDQNCTKKPTAAGVGVRL